MPRYLIVANQTLGGERLDSTVRDRIERGDSEFFIVVPMTHPPHETSAWARGFSVGGGYPVGGYPVGDVTSADARAGMEAEARRQEATIEQARRRAEGRLAQTIERIQSLGGRADGRVGDADPVVAANDVLQEQSFDEVIVSTLPAGISRWVKMDLSSRVSRMTEAPVTTVEAEE